jgi:drug/metabolite transporter (DMT)-like permease
LQAVAEFASTDERDEAISALADQLGPGFKIIEEKTTRLHAILPPMVLLIFTLLAIPLLALLASQLIEQMNLSDSLSLVMWGVIVLLGVLCTIFGLVWLFRRLRQPEELIVINPAAADTGF